MLRACWSSDHLQSFFRNFDVIVVDRSACGESTESKYNKMKKLVTFRTIVIWGFFFFTAASIILQSVTEYNKYFVAGITNPFPHGYIPVTIFFVSLQVWEIGAWLFPILYQVTLFKFLCSGFTSLNNDISKMIEDNSKKIKDIRGKHLQLCKTVAILEEDSKYLLTGTYVTNIFLLCFIVYQMLTSGTLPVIEYLTYSSWLAMNALITIIVSLTAAEVNEKAHSPLDYIYDVDMSETCAFQSVELQMFLFKLNGPAVGFTTMGFVTITKELILTLGGIILTYFLLLIQFKL
ncbi:uncharacterized protein LOC132550798 [Ylistrum balloti]|uniref:uncharacterized protein LOC132550798 n=1 Tax=Ylistrum balloti TaxID=509963 RepID=UPI0029058E2F|nr:uncharacterized protein LOC132550798 [Ylistrum balloti]